MLKLVVALAFALAVPAAAAAQDPVPHPCDIIGVSAVPLPGEKIALGFCTDLKAEEVRTRPDGTTYVAPVQLVSIASSFITIDDAPVPITPDVPIAYRSPNVNALGQFYFITGRFPAPSTGGPHKVALTINAEEQTGSGNVVGFSTDPIAFTVQATDCTPVTGADAIQVFPSRNGISKPSAWLNYSLASRSAITYVGVKVDGTLVRDIPAGPGGDLIATGAIWFPLPPPGSYKLSLLVRNAAGCSAERFAPTDLVSR